MWYLKAIKQFEMKPLLRVRKQRVKITMHVKSIVFALLIIEASMSLLSYIYTSFVFDKLPESYQKWNCFSCLRLLSMTITPAGDFRFNILAISFQL